MTQGQVPQLAYRLRWSGPEGILFIHGLGASKDSFDNCFELESFRGYTLAAVDLPGCGKSEWLNGFSYRMRDQAELVLTWMRALDLAPTILVGHSMGGVIGLLLAERLNFQIHHFFNLEGNLRCDDCVFSGKITSLSWEIFEQRGFRQFKKSLKDALQKNPSPGLKTYYQSISRASPRALYLSSVSLVRESCKGNLEERFLNLPVKKWYVFGERSLNPFTKKFLEENHISFFVVPGSGHFMMDDRPGLFYTMLFEALQNKIQ